MSAVNKEKREAITASTKLINELKVKRDGIVAQLEELRLKRAGVVEEIKVERDKINTLRSELTK